MAATFRIDVIVDPSRATTGARKVRGELDRTDNAADKLRNTIRNTFAGISAALIVRELGRMADAYTNLQNRVRTVTDGQAELDSVTRQLFQIANDTRGAFDATAEVYARTALAAKDLGISQETTLAFTKSLNQAVALGGSAAEEARAGMIQLSQGLASGALRGDELRSVLEQLPVVADVIAKSLGVTRGELRELGSQGKITSTIILDAFAEAREELDQRFAKSVPTLGQAFQVLENNVTEFVGAADQATGVSSALSGTIIFAAQNVDILIAGIFVLAVSAIPTAVTAMSALIASSTILSGVMTAALFNPVILGAAAAGVAFAIVVDRFLDVEEQARSTKQELDKLLLSDEDLLSVTISNVERTLARVQDRASQGLFPDPADAESKISGLNARLEELRSEQDALNDGTGRTLLQIRAQADAVQELDQAVQGSIDSLVAQNTANIETSRELEVRRDLLKQITQIEKESGQEIGPEQEAALRIAQEQAQALRDQAEAFNEIRGPQQEFEARLTALNALQQTGKITLDEFNAAMAELSTSAEGVNLEGLALPEGVDFSGQIEQIRALIAAQREVAAVQDTRVADSVAALQEEQAVLMLLTQGRREEAVLLQTVNDLRRQGTEATEGEAEQIAGLNAQNEALALQAQLLNEISGPQEQYQATQEALNELYAKGSISADEYTASLQRAAEAAGMMAEKTGEAGDTIGDLPEKISPAEQAVNQALGGAFNVAEDSLTSFIRTGEFDFEKFVDGMLDQIARLLAQQALLALFGAPPGAGAAAGGAGGGFGGFFADGGDFSGGAPIVVGEEGPEIITPKGSGEVIPAGETAARLAGAAAPTVNVPAPQVSVPITNVIQGDITSDLDSPEGTEGVLNIIRRNPETVRRA